jgi:calcineurin-like phosphoesterase family protein
MRKTWLNADLHFGHSKLYKMRDQNGALLRPWAGCADEADELFIEEHNKLVRQHDLAIFLGDVSVYAGGLKLLSRMNGKKILVRGNHDRFRLKQYLEHFSDVFGTMKVDRLILSHFPVHPRSVPPWCLANVHGHIHAGDVERRTWWGGRRLDPRYYNICPEKIGPAPIELEDLLSRIATRRQP